MKYHKYFRIQVITLLFEVIIYVGSISELARKMEVGCDQCGGSFKFKWRILFCIVLNILIINVSVRTENVDSGGYIVYCPCMGKMLIHTNVIIFIFKGYVLNCIIVYIR
jgi:hypothetical protein